MPCPMFSMMGSGGMWGMTLFMGLGGLLFLTAIGFGIYLVAQSLRRDDAIMVLRRRLALGEITEAEYNEALVILRR